MKFYICFLLAVLNFLPAAPIRAYSSAPAVVAQAKGKNFGLRSLILEAVKSPVFTHK